jgi:hypothetical protein
MFEIALGLEPPLAIALAVQLRLAAPADRDWHVLNVVRNPLRGVATITLFAAAIPAALQAEPWLMIDGEKRLLRFPKGAPTCDACWQTGHARQICPARAAAAQAECTHCKKRGHAADACWKLQATCHYCGQTGHFKQDCPGLRCNECHGQGHIAKKCPKRKPQQRPRQHAHAAPVAGGGDATSQAPKRHQRAEPAGPAAAAVAGAAAAGRGNRYAGLGAGVIDEGDEENEDSSQDERDA